VLLLLTIVMDCRCRAEGPGQRHPRGCWLAGAAQGLVEVAVNADWESAGAARIACAQAPRASVSMGRPPPAFRPGCP